MNIFVLDQDITRCAQSHCDRHVTKMILESVQMLCTALHTKGFETPYKPTHRNHPCVHWVAESFANFTWLAELAEALNHEYRFRYARQRDHASIQALAQVRHLEYESRGLTPFAQAMPDEYKVTGDAVTAYRQFYLAEKSSFATWTRRVQPDWWIGRHAA